MEQAKRRVSAVAAVAPGHDAAESAPESIGAYLGLQRRLRGISLEELAQATRIPMRSLQRLESGAFDADPDGFVRGFVRTVAEALGLPPHETIARMLPEADVAGQGRGRLRLRRWARVVLGAMLLAAAIAGGWVVVSELGPAPPGASAPEEGLVRRDAVRALALEHGLPTGAPEPAGGRSPAPAGP